MAADYQGLASCLAVRLIKTLHNLHVLHTLCWFHQDMMKWAWEMVWKDALNLAGTDA